MRLQTALLAVLLCANSPATRRWKVLTPLVDRRGKSAPVHFSTSCQPALANHFNRGGSRYCIRSSTEQARNKLSQISYRQRSAVRHARNGGVAMFALSRPLGGNRRPRPPGANLPWRKAEHIARSKLEDYGSEKGLHRWPWLKFIGKTVKDGGCARSGLSREKNGGSAGGPFPQRHRGCDLPTPLNAGRFTAPKTDKTFGQSTQVAGKFWNLFLPGQLALIRVSRITIIHCYDNPVLAERGLGKRRRNVTPRSRPAFGPTPQSHAFAPVSRRRWGRGIESIASNNEVRGLGSGGREGPLRRTEEGGANAAPARHGLSGNTRDLQKADA